MKERPIGAAVASALSVGARGLGVFLYWALRIIYRPNERRVALIVLAALGTLAVAAWAIAR